MLGFRHIFNTATLNRVAKSADKSSSYKDLARKPIEPKISTMVSAGHQVHYLMRFPSENPSWVPPRLERNRLGEIAL